MVGPHTTLRSSSSTGVFWHGRRVARWAFLEILLTAAVDQPHVCAVAAQQQCPFPSRVCVFVFVLLSSASFGIDGMLLGTL